MPGKVFISCGQRVEEMAVVTKIREWLESNNYTVFIAKQTQSLEDVNDAIFGKLKKADYYLFIDFPREKLKGGKGKRGSLFTHQELSVAHLLQFEKPIFLKHKDVILEGMSAYILSNATVFDSDNDLLEKVKQAINDREWDPSYSRHLIVTPMADLSEPVEYRDHTGTRKGRILHVQVENKRSVSSATCTVARLKHMKKSDGTLIDFDDDNTLKWAGRAQCYQINIPQNSSRKFDAYLLDEKGNVYLNSCYDFSDLSGTRAPVLKYKGGKYIFVYEIHSIGFESVTIDIPFPPPGVFIEGSGQADLSLQHIPADGTTASFCINWKQSQQNNQQGSSIADAPIGVSGLALDPPKNEK